MANLLKEIEKMLEGVIDQSLKEASNEQGIQLQKAKEIKDDKRSLRAVDSDKKVDEADEDEEEKKQSSSGGDMSKRPVEIPDELPASITIDMVIDGVNAIRSARSLKDPEVREEFEEYFNSLSAPEKIGLLAYVYGIAETLIGNSPGKGLDPSEEPYNISMQADPQQSSRPSTAAAPEKGEAAADTPIVVGGN